MRWRAYLLFGFLLVGAFALMLDPVRRFERDTIEPDESYLSRVAAQRRSAATELRDLNLLDSLTAILSSEAPEGGFILGVHPGIRLIGRNRVTEKAQELLATAERPVRLGLFLVDGSAHIPPEISAGWLEMRRPRVIAGKMDGMPYCIRMRPVVSTQIRRELTLGTPIGTEAEWVRDFGLCAWVVRFGLPGPELADWLGLYGGTMAQSWLPVDSSPLAHDQIRLMGYPEGRTLRDACRLGESTDCAELFEVPENWSRPSLARTLGGDPDGPFVFQVDRWGEGFTPNGVGDFSLLADLEREFGVDAFGRFWTSDRPVTEAFAAAFGVEAGEWYAERTEERWEGVMAGTAFLDPGALLMTLVMLGVGFWIATGAARRRKVG